MSHRIALLVDFDNAQIAASDEDFRNCAASAVWALPLVRAVEAQCEGQADIRRVYGNTLHHVQDTLRSREWNPKNLREKMDLDVSIQHDLGRHGFQVIHCPTGQGRKNRADILMALDCMEIAVNYSHIDTFAILSHDSDFSALIQRLRAIGKRVALVSVGRMGEDRSRILTSLANVRVSYDQQSIDECGPRQLLEVLDEIRQQPEGIPTQGLTAEMLRARVRQKLPEFHSQDLGYAKVGDFLQDCLDGSPYRITEGKVFLVAVATPPPSSQAAGAKVPPPMQTHEAKVRAVLAMRDVRFHAVLRDIILERVRSILEGHPAGNGPVTFGALQEKVLGLPELAEHSKSRIRDILKTLKNSGALATAGNEGGSIKDTVITGCRGQDESRNLLVSFAADILASNGMPLTKADIPILAELVFGQDSEAARRQVSEFLSSKASC
jgi:uncharacterized LabA/DUF88 family protein